VSEFRFKVAFQLRAVLIVPAIHRNELLSFFMAVGVMGNAFREVFSICRECRWEFSIGAAYNAASNTYKLRDNATCYRARGKLDDTPYGRWPNSHHKGTPTRPVRHE
jgi:hypothetical protein